MTLALLDAPRPDAPLALPAREAALASDITYAHAVPGRLRPALVRLAENVTGRPALIRRVAGYESDLEQGRDFWRVMTDRFGLRLDLISGALGNIPASGPLLVVANHPFGILDGLVLGHILSAARGREFRILANHVFCKAPALEDIILPIDFSGTPLAMETNIASRAGALSLLARGGAVGVFPGGTVSTAAQPFGRPLDPAWRSFTARMIQRSGAQVVPIWFEGGNSRLFQLASHVSPTLRLALLIREFRRRVDKPVRLAIGQPLAPERLAGFGANGKEMMDFLRAATYELSPKPLNPYQLGHEFEAHHRRERAQGTGRGTWRLGSSIRGLAG